jgi:hypothetical protein
LEFLLLFRKNDPEKIGLFGFSIDISMHFIYLWNENSFLGLFRISKKSDEVKNRFSPFAKQEGENRFPWAKTGIPKGRDA